MVAGPPHDLVVLDLMLPKRDGFEVLRQARSKHVETPVLVLTARDGVSDKVMGLDLGADDYLTKPFAFEEFLARVRALLRRRSGSRAPVLRRSEERRVGKEGRSRGSRYDSKNTTQRWRTQGEKGP